MAIPQIGKRGRPSIQLVKEDYVFLKKMVRKSDSIKQLAISLSMDRVSLTRIIRSGSGAPANIRKLSRKLSKLQSA